MIQKFKFYPVKVLPLVYDESLSYYEFLCKMLRKLNEIIDLFNNEFERKIEEIGADWEAYKGNATAELEEIIRKFDGDKQEIINEIKTEIMAEIDSTITEKVGEAITQYIDQYDATIKAYIDAQDKAIKDYFNALISNRLFLYTTNIGWNGAINYNHSNHTAQITGEISYIDSTETHGLWSFTDLDHSIIDLSAPVDQTPGQAHTSGDWFFLCINMSKTGATVAGQPFICVRVHPSELLDFEKYRPLLRYNLSNYVPISVYAHFSKPDTGFNYT